MCSGGADFQTSSGNVTGFSSFGGPTVQSTSTGNVVGGFNPSNNMSFGEQYALSSTADALFKSLAAFRESSALRDAQLHKAHINRINAQIVELQKKDERLVSKKERDALRRKITALQQKIAPTTAANNILIGGGSPLDTLISSDIYKTADMGQAKVNEEKRIFGLDVKKYNFEAQADVLESSASRISPLFDATSTLMTSASSSAIKYLGYKQSAVRGTTSALRTAFGL